MKTIFSSLCALVIVTFLSFDGASAAKKSKTTAFSERELQAILAAMQAQELQDSQAVLAILQRERITLPRFAGIVADIRFMMPYIDAERVVTTPCLFKQLTAFQKRSVRKMLKVTKARTTKHFLETKKNPKESFKHTVALLQKYQVQAKKYITDRKFPAGKVTSQSIPRKLDTKKKQ